MPEKNKTIKKRNTTFCQSKPSNLIKNVVVFMKEEGVWVVCKGKLYRNYLLKYFHNGKSAIIDGNSYRYWGDGYNDVQMQEIVTSMNLEILEMKRLNDERTKRDAERTARRAAAQTNVDMQYVNRFPPLTTNEDWGLEGEGNTGFFGQVIYRRGDTLDGNTAITEIINGNTND